jgi:hypothetical protein
MGFTEGCGVFATIDLGQKVAGLHTRALRIEDDLEHDSSDAPYRRRD